MSKRPPTAVGGGEAGLGRAASSSPTAAGGHLVAEALSLGAHPILCPVHDEEQWVVGSKTGRVGHYIKTLDDRRAICVAGEEVIEVKR